MARHLFALDCVLDSIVGPDAGFGVRCPIHTRTRRETLEFKIGECSGGLDE